MRIERYECPENIVTEEALVSITIPRTFRSPGLCDSRYLVCPCRSGDKTRRVRNDITPVPLDNVAVEFVTSHARRATTCFEMQEKGRNGDEASAAVLSWADDILGFVGRRVEM